MTHAAKAVAIIVYLLGTVSMFLLSGGKYDWLIDIDPSLPPGSFEEDAGNRMITLGLLVIACVASQVFLAFTAKSGRSRAASVAFAALAIAIYAAA